MAPNNIGGFFLMINIMPEKGFRNGTAPHYD
jgi:hypothetical protein